MTANHYDTEIFDTINDLKRAKKNHERILSDYEDTPQLIEFYLPSAEHLVNELNMHLKYLIESETNMQLDTSTNYVEPDIWIRLEGETFEGKGQIGVVGAYLQKLNIANKQAVNLIGRIHERFEKVKGVLSNISSLDLVSTAQGSFKLGLKRTDINPQFGFEQLDLFYSDDVAGDAQKLEDLKDLEELSIEGIKLIAETIESSQNDELFGKLKERYGENDFKKLIHYTKELVPTSRSAFDKVFFEGNYIDSFQNVEATRDTRKFLIEKEKTLTRESTFIEGEGWFRAVDMDNFTATIRPLHYKDTTLGEISCKFSKERFTSNDIASFIDKFFSVNGFLVYNQHQEPIRLDVEEVILKNTSEIED